MEPWGANHTIIRMISTPTVPFITPFGMVCTLHFLQCTYSTVCIIYMIYSINHLSITIKAQIAMAD